MGGENVVVKVMSICDVVCVMLEIRFVICIIKYADISLVVGMSLKIILYMRINLKV